MYKKILVLILIAMIFSGCNLKLSNTSVDEKPLVINEIRIPKHLHGLENIEEFRDVEIIYKTDSSINLEITFSETLKDKNYPIALFQFGRYNHVENENDATEKSNYLYNISDNKIVIYPTRGYPMGIKSIYIPNSLETQKSKRLKKDMIIIFSPNTRTPISELNFINTNLEKEVKSLILVKEKNDNKNIAFINTDKTPLFKTSDMKEISFELQKGENILIKGAFDNWESKLYSVELYIPKDYNEDFLNSKENIYSDKYVNIISGYVKSEDLTIIPEPLNEKTAYTVKLSSEHGKPEAYVCIYPKPYGGYEIPIGNAKKLEQKDLYLLESISAFMWPDMLPGSNYWATYGDGKGGVYSKLDMVPHMPEINWNKEEYQNYNIAYQLYIDHMFKRINEFIVPAELADYKKDILENFQDRVLLQNIWIDWGYSRELDSDNWFFNEIIKRFNFSKEEEKKYSKLFSTEYTDDKTQNFDMKIIDFLKPRNNIGEYVQSVQNTLEKKYRENNKPEFVYNIELDAIVKSIISNKEIIVIGKDDKKEYTLKFEVEHYLINEWKDGWILTLKGFYDDTFKKDTIVIKDARDIRTKPEVNVNGIVKSIISENQLILVDENDKNEYIIKFINGFALDYICEGNKIAISGFYDDENNAIETNEYLVRNYSTDMEH